MLVKVYFLRLFIFRDLSKKDSRFKNTQLFLNL